MKIETALAALVFLALASGAAPAVTIRYVGHCGDKTHTFQGQKFAGLKDCRVAAANHKAEPHKGGAKAVKCVNVDKDKM